FSYPTRFKSFSLSLHVALPIFVRRVFLVVVLVAVDEQDDVGILLDGARFAQVGHHRALVGTRFQRAVELGQRHHRHVELLGQGLERTADLRDLGGAVLAVARHLHQLQVVDHHQAQAVLALETAALGTQHVRRQRRGVVDEDLGFLQHPDRAGDAAPVLVLQLAGTQALGVDPAVGGDQAQRQLRGRHFHREHRHRLLRLDRRVLGDVQREGGLAHRGTRGKDDQVRRLQAGGHVVELGVAGPQAGDVAAALEALLQHLEGVAQRGVEAGEVGAAAGAGLGDGEHLLLGAGQQLGAVAAFRLEAVVDDLGADLDQLPQHRLVAHDLGVGADVGGRRRGRGQLDQVGAAADLLRIALRVEPLAQGHRVERLALLGQLADRAVDQLVVAAVEVLLHQHVADGVVRLRRQHQATQHRLLGLDRVRRDPQLLDAAIGAIAVTVAFAVSVFAEAGACCHSGWFLGLAGAAGARPGGSGAAGHRMRWPGPPPWIPLCITRGHLAGRDAHKSEGRLAAPSVGPAAWADQASGSTTTLTVVSTSACRAIWTSNSPTWRIGPSPMMTSLFSTGRPAAVKASAMSRGPTEPYSLPSVEALALTVTLAPSSLARRPWASSSRALALASYSARLASNSARLAAVAGTA